MKFKLYHYWRSSASWRVRIALDLKKISAQMIPISLLNGESESPAYRSKNPLGYVPSLEVLDRDQSQIFFESLPIIEWLDETQPGPKLLPADPVARARTRQLAEIINAGTQPITNLTVLDEMPLTEEQRKKWVQRWINNGLHAFETQVAQTRSSYCVGDQLSLADLCLIPQCYNARRFDIDLNQYPNIFEIDARVNGLEACRSSHPDRYQPQT